MITCTQVCTCVCMCVNAKKRETCQAVTSRVELKEEVKTFLFILKSPGVFEFFYTRDCKLMYV